MNKISKIFGAIAIAGVVAAGSAAFTAGGLNLTGNAAQGQFIGGTVVQTVEGATLDNIDYAYSDPAHKVVSSVTLTFAEDMEGRTITAVSTPAASTPFDCEVVEVLPNPSDDVDVLCTGVVTDLESLSVNVADSQ